MVKSAGLSHSEIHGLMLACSSPWLIATCYVLHRLLAPRHSPQALSSLITKLTLALLCFAKSSNTQLTVIFYALKMLCVVVKEHPVYACIKLFKPDAVASGKFVSVNGGPDWT